MKTCKINAVFIGVLFIFTMLSGMVDAYFVIPGLNNLSPDSIQNQGQILIGVFSVLVMAVGILFIALNFYPVIKNESETIAITYVVFRTIECLLLIVGSICYLYIISLKSTLVNGENILQYSIQIALAMKIKYYSYQVAMIILGFGSLFLCYALYTSRIVPRFLSVWGGIGYLGLLLSAVLDICGLIDTTKGMGTLLYIPGGLWEMIIFPVWMFAKGFNTSNFSNK